MNTDLQQTIHELGPWFHNLHLPDGTQTAPDHFLGDFPSFKWDTLAPHLPEDLSGWRVLDIGCNAGFYCFQLARRGATVVGMDVDEHYLTQARWAAGQFGVNGSVEFRRMQVYDLAQCNESFDLVLFMGVFYHLRYPLLALDIVSQKVKRMMVFQTLTMPGEEVYPAPSDIGIYERDAMREPGWPHLAFIENRLAGDPTNWWAPNHAAVLAMMRSCGIRVTHTPGQEIYLCEPDPENPSCVSTWDREELLSATGQRNRQ
ncbi:MAG: TIGR04290 family methyltransferase [Armatimonadetes bacterium]|nr:TIGR04290 family methyltransferase [Armatimonadota bacterium]